MQLTCFNCKNTWDLPAGHMLSAKLKFGLGYKEYGFVCPNCEAENVVTKNEFESSNQPGRQIPVTGARSQSETDAERPARADDSPDSAPTNPIPGPEPSPMQRQGVVLVRGLEIRREHSIWAEVMAGLRKGEEVTVFDIWTDGENTWAHLGPERWVEIERNGETLIELSDD